MYIVTSDKEKAIRSGLRMSQMPDMTIHFSCSLHERWNVRDHICGSGGSCFGEAASHAWNSCMFRAEGPAAFMRGYRQLLEKYDDDEPRKNYVRELFHDPKKAHFKRGYKFRNGTLVDACETLFSATKTWVMGNSRHSTSLLMAVVRIVDGCREMIIRPYLKPEKLSERATVSSRTGCRPVVQLFEYCIKHLTVWAVKNLYTMLDKSWLVYDLDPVTDDAGAQTGDIKVTRRNAGDSFVVRQDCTCWTILAGEEKKCWQQTYTGLPCRHAILTTVDRMREAYRDKDARQLICEAFVSSCNPNWLRSTYSTSRDIVICKPAPIQYRKALTEEGIESKLIRRFRQVVPFLPHALVRDVIQQLESRALEPKDTGFSSDAESDSDTPNSDTESDSNTSVDSTIPSPTTYRSMTRPDLLPLREPKKDNPLRYSNPPIDTDRKKRKRYNDSDY